MNIMQGDSYGIVFKLKAEDGSLLTTDTVSDVEVSVGADGDAINRWAYADGSVTFDESDSSWMAMLTQKMTLAYTTNPVKRYRTQVRIKFKDGTVNGVDLGPLTIAESLSKVEL